MKRVGVMFIVFGMLFGFGSNMFGYKWDVQNATNELTISVNFCTTPGIDSCQNADIGSGAIHTFAFEEWYNKGLLFGSAKVNDYQSFDSITFINQTDLDHARGGSVRVIKNDDGSYAFKVND